MAVLQGTLWPWRLLTSPKEEPGFFGAPPVGPPELPPPPPEPPLGPEPLPSLLPTTGFTGAREPGYASNQSRPQNEVHLAP